MKLDSPRALKQLNVSGSANISDSLNVDGSVSASSFSGSLIGSAETATSASFAETASFALNAGVDPFPFSGSAEISGSLGVTDRVGIGIAIPTERRIDVDGGEVRIGQSSAGTGAWLAVNLRNGTTAPAAARFALRSTASESETIPITQPNLILNRGSDGSGTLLKFTNQRTGFAGIGSAADANNLHDIRFYSGDGSERIRVNPSGSVGIGITSPSTKLHVSGSVSASSFEGNVTGSVNATGDILPSVSDQFDIGSDTLRFRDIYLSGSTIFLGNVKLSESEEGTLKIVDGNETEVIVGEIDTGSIDLRLDSLESESGSIRTDFNNFTGSSGIISGSGQISITDTDGFDTFSGSVSSSLETKIDITDIVDDLISTSSNTPLSANQGKILQDALGVGTTGATIIAKGTDAQRPELSVTGMIRYNTDRDILEYYDGDIEDWVKITAEVGILATGGTVTDITVDGVDYRVHSFTEVGTSSFQVLRGGEVE